MNKKFVDAKYVMDQYDIDMKYLCEMCDENKILCYSRVTNGRVYSSTYLYSEPKYKRSNHVSFMDLCGKKIIFFGIEFGLSKNIDLLTFSSFGKNLSNEIFFVNQYDIGEKYLDKNFEILFVQLNGYYEEQILEILSTCDKIEVQVNYVLAYESLVDFSFNPDFKKVNIEKNNNINTENKKIVFWNDFLEESNCIQLIKNECSQFRLDKSNVEKELNKLCCVIPRKKNIKRCRSFKYSIKARKSFNFLIKNLCQLLNNIVLKKHVIEVVKKNSKEVVDKNLSTYFDMICISNDIKVDVADQNLSGLDLEIFLDQDNRITLKTINSKLFSTHSNYSYQAAEKAKLIFQDEDKDMYDYAEFLTIFDRDYYLSKEKDRRMYFKKDYFIFNFELYNKLKYPNNYDEALESFTNYVFSLQFDLKQITEHFLNNDKNTNKIRINHYINIWKQQQKIINCKSEIYSIIDIYIDRLENQKTYLELYKIYMLKIALEKIQENDDEIKEDTANKAITRLFNKLEKYAISNGLPYCSQQKLKDEKLIRPRKSAPRKKFTKKSEGRGQE